MKRFIHDRSAVDTMHKIDEYRNEYVDSCNDVQASEEYDQVLDDYYGPDRHSSEWEFMDRKQVLDYNGFYTDYTLYHNKETGEWVTVFGDRDLYRPEDGNFDAEFDTEWEAREWFDSYSTDEDGDDLF